ncbi:MAG TPA: DUF423 domain-containing protein [Chitinophagaceae bacterium]|nr:DUF423 domain-containing protein [Chitinophagaceae bacterium]
MAAVFGGSAVALGAFGAHGLERITTDEKVLQGFRTGVQYQVYHALALLVIAGLYDKFPQSSVKWAARCFITGILLFSGSLYLLTFLKIQGSSAIKFAGPVTPLGGIFLILGWIFLLVAAMRRN